MGLGASEDGGMRVSAEPSSRMRRRSFSEALKAAIEGGQHRVDYMPDGRISILPLAVDPAQAQATALDAEIQELMGDGDGRP